MAREPRIDLPGIPQHVVQRGNDHFLCGHGTFVDISLAKGASPLSTFSFPGGNRPARFFLAV